MVGFTVIPDRIDLLWKSPGGVLDLPGYRALPLMQRNFPSAFSFSSSSRSGIFHRYTCWRHAKNLPCYALIIVQYEGVGGGGELWSPSALGVLCSSFSPSSFIQVEDRTCTATLRLCSSSFPVCLNLSPYTYWFYFFYLPSLS